jgi:lysophospholipase L1-like esterase
MHIKWLLSCLLFSTILLGQQSQPFQNEFLEFKKQDSIVKPPHRPIVFAGSSSFRLWKTIQSDFSGYPILNRGFGGATLLDLEVRLQESVLQYRPKQVFIYCGENDFASDDQVTPELVFDRFKRIFYLIRHKHKRVNIVFVSIKPSVARWTLESKFVAANQLIRTFLSTKPNTSFADVHQAMLDENGNVYANLFIQDNLHMNAKGYQIWSTLLRPYLLKE